MTEKHSRKLFWVSVVVALVLQLFELPYWLSLFRPLCLPLVLAYWALVGPQSGTGLTAAWFSGLLQDVLLGTVLGQHALGMVAVVFCVRSLRNFLSLFQLWQAGIALLPLWLLYAFLMFWIDGASGHLGEGWLRWMPVLATLLLWSPCVKLLDLLRRIGQEDPNRL